MGLFRSPRSRPGGSGAQEGRFRSPNRPNHQSREQMGLFAHQGAGKVALVRRKAGSAHQTERITSLVSKWGCSAHQGAGQVALVRRKGCSAHQTDRISSLVSKKGCSAHQGAGQMALVRRKAGSAHQTDRITSLVSKWGCSAHEGAGQVLWCAGRPVPLTKSNRCGHGRSAVGNGQSATGSWQQAAGNGQRGTGNGERATSSGERTGRRNRLRKGSATKALIIQHLNVDNCLQIRIILTTIAKIADGKTEGKSWLTSIISDFPQHDTN